jgi:hypothetical protein
MALNRGSNGSDNSMALESSRLKFRSKEVHSLACVSSAQMSRASSSTSEGAVTDAGRDLIITPLDNTWTILSPYGIYDDACVMSGSSLHDSHSS